MQKILGIAGILLFTLTAPAPEPVKRLWVLRASGQMVEYDPATFAEKQIVALPAGAAATPTNISVNGVGQILIAETESLPLSEEDAKGAHRVWLWTGHAAALIDQGLKRDVVAAGSNQAITEAAPQVSLSADGAHLYWFANQARRLQRDGVDLSTTTTWQAWRTDLSGNGREELATEKFPDCRCATGTCEESCPYGVTWTTEGGVESFFLMNQFVAGQSEPIYKSSTLHAESGGKWTAQAFGEPLQRVLDASADGKIIVEAIPDTGCCGWVNQSDDQTLVLIDGKKRVVFDERASYQNLDYDVSFYTSNAKLSPELAAIAVTIASTAQANQPIQLAEKGEANPEESRKIRKALAELPAVEVKKMDEPEGRIAFLPHATLVGWISEKELLIVEDRVLVIYNLTTGARRKSKVPVEDASGVFLR